MSRPILLLLLGLVVATVAVAGRGATVGGLAPGAAPTSIRPLPFDHQRHDQTFVDRGITCLACHPVGARTAEGALSEPLPIPLETCHGCHLGEVRGAPKAATPSCSQCHADRAELLPTNHHVGWMEEHGIEARALSAGCDSCHDRRTCLTCHETRGALTRTPHMPGFRATHGVEARVDPASCARCHVEASCTECHATGVIPW